MYPQCLQSLYQVLMFLHMGHLQKYLQRHCEHWKTFVFPFATIHAGHGQPASAKKGIYKLESQIINPWPKVTVNTIKHETFPYLPPFFSLFTNDFLTLKKECFNKVFPDEWLEPGKGKVCPTFPGAFCHESHTFCCANSCNGTSASLVPKLPSLEHGTWQLGLEDLVVWIDGLSLFQPPYT